MMRLKVRRALAAGFFGALAAVIVALAGWWLLRRFDPTVRAAASLAALSVLPWLGWVAVVPTAVAGGTVLAVFYALAFEFVTRRAGWWIGAGLGVANVAAVWLGVGLLSWMFPGVAEYFAQELFVLFDSIAAVIGYVAVHLVYGALVGTLYGTPLHEPDEKGIVTWRELSPTKKEIG
jgi:zinc transporter ZupT